jgi:hypothetical protein
MFGDHLFGQFKQRGFVAFFGHLDQGAFLVFRQATELAQLAVADAHAGHGFQGFFAEGGKIGNIQIGLIRRYSEQAAKLIPCARKTRTVRCFASFRLRYSLFSLTKASLEVRTVRENCFKRISHLSLTQ